MIRARDLPEDWPEELKRALTTPVPPLPELEWTGSSLCLMAHGLKKLILLANHYGVGLADLAPAAPIFLDLFPGLNYANAKPAPKGPTVRTAFNDAALVFTIDYIKTRDDVGAEIAARTLLKEFPRYNSDGTTSQSELKRKARTLKTRYLGALKKSEVAAEVLGIRGLQKKWGVSAALILELLDSERLRPR